MAVLFPIGTLQNNSNLGVIASNYTYSMFEPNSLCDSKVIRSTIMGNFQNQTMFVRKVALPYLGITYTYENIFAREFAQIDHFISDSTTADGGATSFYVIDFSNGDLPTSVTSGFHFHIPNTVKYSSISNQKSNNVFYWDGFDFKVGVVTTTTATTVTTNTTANPYGAMTGTTFAAGTVWVYPIYQCFLSGSPDFKSTQFWPSDDTNKGFLTSGSISFLSKYRV
jgi:hypothetical protein